MGRKRFRTEDLWDLKEVYSRIVDQSRWSTFLDVVVQDDDGRFYSFVREIGSTECQEVEQPEYTDCEEVEEAEVTIKQWRPVE